MSPIDKKGCFFEVRSYSPEDYSHLEEMYDGFFPKAKFQGMPPFEKRACRKWIKGLLEAGENFLAWQEDGVVGHAVLLPEFRKGDAEYLIFVSQSSRGGGVGSELTRMAIERAKGLDLNTIWLTVDAYNFRATRLYKRFGFQFSEAYKSESERMMVLQL